MYLCRQKERLHAYFDIDMTKEQLTDIAVENGYMYTDASGVKFTFDRKWILGVDREVFKCKSYEIPTGVECLCDWAFYGQKQLESIKLPDTLTYIGDNQFIRCVKLKELTVPDSVYYLGACVCEACTALERVRLPKNLKEIQIASFNGCSSLKDVVLPEDLEAIDGNAFAHTHQLKSIQLPSTLKWIGGEAFWDSGIQKISIPKGVGIAEDAFLDCQVEIERNSTSPTKSMPC